MTGHRNMCSAENIRSGSGEDLHLWRTREVVKDDSKSVEEMIRTSNQQMFKSSFAARLELKEVTKSFLNVNIDSTSSCTSDLGSGMKSWTDRDQHEETLVFSQAVDEFLKMKAENERLRSKVEICNEFNKHHSFILNKKEFWMTSKFNGSKSQFHAVACIE